MSAKKYHVVTSGYVSMDRIIKIKTPANVGFTSIVENRNNTEIQYGGCSVNIAHNLCRLGLNALPIMRAGGDYEQIGFKSFLENANIPTDALDVLNDEITSQCYLIQDNQGQHITLFYPGAMDGKFAKLMPSDWFSSSQMGIITVGAREDNEYFFQSCKQNNLPLVLSMKGDMDAFPTEFLLELLAYSQIIFTNEVERSTIENLTGKSLLELLDTGSAKVIVTTLGSEGSRCYTKNAQGKLQEEYIPICNYGTALDTTGCGDGYVSGFMYGYLGGKSPRECAMLGTVHSSFIIEKEGCCTGAPTASQLEQRYQIFAKQEGVMPNG